MVSLAICRMKRSSSRRKQIYDPQQDEREVAEIRNDYSELLDEVSRNKRELVSVESGRLTQMVGRSNNVFDKGKGSSECIYSFFSS